MDNMESMKILKALADETRLRMLKLLREKELCVCEIQGALDLNQSNTSRHLSRLKDAYLVQQAKDGQWIYYKINPERFAEYPFINELLDQVLQNDELLQNAQQLIKEYQTKGNPCSKG